MKKSILFFFLFCLTPSICQAASGVTAELEEPLPSQLTDSMVKKSQDIIRLNIGPGWIVSEIETDYNIYKRKVGFSASADYLHYWKSGWGVGANYMFYNASFDEGFSINIHYIGPCIAGSTKFGGRWRWDSTLGAGYAYYKEIISSNYGGISYELSAGQGRFASIVQTGIEYKISDKVGIGIQLNGFLMSQKKPEGYTDDKYDFYGIKRYDVQVGARIYL